MKWRIPHILLTILRLPLALALVTHSTHYPLPPPYLSMATLESIARDIANLESRLHTAFQEIRPRIDTLESRVAALAARPPPHVPTSTPAPVPRKRGKKQASTSIRSTATALPLPLAQDFPKEGSTDRRLCTVVVPDALAGHVVGRQGKGLKQVHDISGARITAYSLTKSSSEVERHFAIRGTDLQIGDALVVVGKRLARKRVRTPKPKGKKTAPAPAAPSPRPPARAPVPPSAPTAPTSTAQSPYRGAPTPTSARTPASPMPISRQSSSTTPSSSLTPGSPMQVGATYSDTPRRQTARRGGGPQ